MSDVAINQLIETRVAKALANQEQLRNSSMNGDGSQNSRSGTKRPTRTPRECTFKDFLNCQPLNFKGTEGVFSTCTLLGATLTWWNSHVHDSLDMKWSHYGIPENLVKDYDCQVMTKNENSKRVKGCFPRNLMSTRKSYYSSYNPKDSLAMKVHQGHYKSDCLKLRNQNHGNQAEDTEAHGVVYALGGEKTDQDPNNIEDEIEAQEEDFLASTSER
ncbi:hypothetical protein Tco_0473997 [Tanacetum coccineum]